jgi:hypothetical protein
VNAAATREEPAQVPRRCQCGSSGDCHRTAGLRPIACRYPERSGAVAICRGSTHSGAFSSWRPIPSAADGALTQSIPSDGSIPSRPGDAKQSANRKTRDRSRSFHVLNETCKLLVYGAFLPRHSHSIVNSRSRLIGESRGSAAHNELNTDFLTVACNCTKQLLFITTSYKAS